MATNIFNFDGRLLTTVADGTLDITHASIKLPGRGYQNYGEPVLEGLLWILENFAGNQSPPLPQTGQLWFDTATGSGSLKVWNGNEWQNAGGVTIADTPPPNPLLGALWYDTINLQLKVWSGKTWDIIGPLGSKPNLDPIDPTVQVNSVVEAMRVYGVEDGKEHSLWRVSIAGIMLCIISKDQVFTPQSGILTNGGFPKIYPGINFNTKIANIGINGDETIFKSTKTNLPSVSRTWNLGSATKEFNTFYSQTGFFSNKVGIGTVSGAYTFEVNGTTRLDGKLTLAPGTKDNPPIAWSASSTLTTEPQVGALEFDGNNFYFTGLLDDKPVRRTPLWLLNLDQTKNLFVSSIGGSDSNSGRSKMTPLKTIRRALEILYENSLEGYTVFVESGDYLEHNPMYVPPKTSIVGDNLRRVSIRPVHNKLDIFHTAGSNYFYGLTFKDHRAPAFAFAFPCSTATATIEDGVVTGIKPTFSWGSYMAAYPPAVFIESPPYGTGTNSRASATSYIVDGAITDIYLKSGGSGYTSAPAVTITGSDNSGTDCVAVARIDINPQSPTYKQVIAIDIEQTGLGYLEPITVTIAGGAGSGAVVSKVVVQDGVIGGFTVESGGSGYIREPWISIKPPNPEQVFSSPYVQNCSSITGPFDVNGKLITLTPPYETRAGFPVGSGYGELDPEGAGSGIRIDGEVLDNDADPSKTVIRSFVADAFTQINQGGVGHLMLNRGYAQFVSCFTTFSSIGYWARNGGFCNISNSVIDFGDIGLKAEGYYPTGYSTGISLGNYSSTVLSITVVTEGTGKFKPLWVWEADLLNGRNNPARGTAAKCNIFTDKDGFVTAIAVTDPGSDYWSEPTIDWSTAPAKTGETITEADLPVCKIVLKVDTDEKVIDGLQFKPQFGTAMLVNNEFYIVSNVIETGISSRYKVVTNPPIWAMDNGDQCQFFEISNISTGGLALEYIGSGVTYNALPYYNGVPDITKQIIDGEDPTSPCYPGRIYYVTIDNTGNFRVGPYFRVNFVDGSVEFNAKTMKLPHLDSIGPFLRNGQPVGLIPGPGYADEISSDPSLTHLDSTLDYDNVPLWDKTTLPTQNAVRDYFKQVNSDITPNRNSDNVYVLGTHNLRWKELWVHKANISVFTGTDMVVVNDTSINFDTQWAKIGIGTTFHDERSYSRPRLSVGGANVGIGTNRVCVEIWPQGNNWNERTSLTLWSTFYQNPGTGDHYPRRTADIVTGFSPTITATTASGVVNPPSDVGAWAHEYLSFNVGNSTVNSGGYSGYYASDNDSCNMPKERMRIDGWGRVGVGTNSVRNQLEIWPHTTYNNVFNNERDWNGLAIFSGKTNSDYVLYMGADSTNHVSYIQSRKYNTDNAALSLNAKGGYVGIGTIKPNTQLHLWTPATAALGRFQSENASGTARTEYMRGTNISWVGVDGDANEVQLGTLETIPIRFWINNQPKVSILADGKVGIGETSPTKKLHVVGDTLLDGPMYVTGVIYGSDDIIGFYTSDERLKTNVVAINDALMKVNSIDGVTFDWTDAAKEGHTHRESREAGVLAQQIEAVLPEVVTTREDGFKAVNYEKIVPLLIQAIKELTVKVETLEKKLQ
jgi:hypothetical protein